MKHTPAPWSLSTTGNLGFRINEFTGDAKEDVANKHLIQAAPDLLEALKAARKLIVDHGLVNTFGYSAEYAIGHVIAEAIAKVEE